MIDLIRYALNWEDKSQFQRDCVGLGIAILFTVCCFILFLWSSNG